MDITQKNKDKSVKIASLLRWMPNKIYLKILYRLKTGRKLNLKNPVGFNDKMNWLKLHNINKSYSNYVDKIKAKEIVKDKIGEEHVIPLIGVWDRFDDIDFSKLPNSFVLKCNHDSGSAKVIKNKNDLTEQDIKSLRKHFKHRLKTNMFYFAREYPYKKLKPQIFAEKYMVDESNYELKDYKFYCFNGVPEIYYIAKERGPDTRMDFYDMKCNHLDIVNIHYNSDHPVIGKPPHFEEMVEIAKTLSKGFPFVRIDLFSTKDNVYFAEYTFFAGAGLYLFEPEKWEKHLGDLIKL